jgi:hypothetical protein
MATILRTIAPTGGDYTSLAAWEAGEQTDLVTAGDTHVVEIQGDWSGGPDTTAVVVNGWTTSSTNDITIRTDAANKASAKWDASKYVLNVPDSSTAGIAIYSAHLRLVGVQVLLESTTSSTQYGVRTLTGAGHVFEADGCYFRGTVNGGTGAIVGIGSNNSNAFNLISTRCIYKDCTNGVTFSYAIDFTKTPYTGNHVAYSNTIYGCVFGIRSNTAGASLIKNNLIAAGTSGSGVYDFHDTFATGSDYNATTSTDTVGTGSNNISSATVVFRDAANHDLHITNGSTSIIDAGTDLSADATWPLESVDIDGESRGTWDIGADEWSPLEVVSIVAPSGGDYTSLSAWESGEQADLVTADEKHVAEIQGDWSGGPDTVGVTISGWTMDSDHRVTIRTDSANRAGAKWDAARYVLQSAGAQCINIGSGNWVNLDGLQVRNTRNATFTRTIYLNQGTGREVNISNCFVVGEYAQAGNVLVYNNFINGGDQVTKVWNTIVTYLDLQSSNGQGVYCQTASGWYYNCLAYNTDDGFKRNGGASYVKNCIAANNPNSGFYNWLTGSDYNTSSDATAPGANSQTNVTPIFIDPANLDFRLSPYDAIAQGNGTSLYAEGITTDIEGTSRGTASATTFDIGAHHQTQTTRTIKPSGGDYTSLSAWEAGEQQDLVANNKSATAEISGDWSGGPDTTNLSVDGWTVDSIHTITIRTDAANRASATWDATKYRLENTTSSTTSFFMIKVPFTHIVGLQVFFNRSNGSDRTIYVLLGADNVSIDGCFVRGSGESLVYDHSGCVRVINSVLSATNSARAIYWNCWAGASKVGLAYNCTAYNPSASSSPLFQRYGNTTVTVKNVTATGGSLSFSGVFNAASDYNTSSDATAVGANSQTGVTPAFVDAAGLDFHLASGDTIARGNGTDLSSDATYPFSDDIDGDTRSAWDIGADEYQAPVGGTTHNAAGTSDAFAGASASATKVSSAVGLGLATGSMTGAASRVLPASATALCIAGASASGVAVRNASASVSGVAAATGTVAGLISLAGSLSASAAVQGVMRTVRAATVALNAAASMQGVMRTVRAASAALAAQAVCSATGFTAITGIGVVYARATMTGNASSSLDGKSFGIVIPMGESTIAAESSLRASRQTSQLSASASGSLFASS